MLLSPLGLIPLGLPGADAQPVNRNTPTTYAPTWAGFYAGLNFGLNSDQARVTGTNPALGGFLNYCFANNCGGTNSSTATGVIGGIQFGYNFQTGSVVYGLEADFDFSSARKSTTGPFTLFGGAGTWTINSGIESLSTLRGRIGYAFDSSLIYATGGLAVAKTRHSIQPAVTLFGSGPYSFADAGWRTGYAVGGGWEYRFARSNWTVRAEALYYDLGTANLVSKTNLGTTAYAFGATDKITGVVARFGLNYLFH